MTAVKDFSFAFSTDRAKDGSNGLGLNPKAASSTLKGIDKWITTSLTSLDGTFRYAAAMVRKKGEKKRLLLCERVCVCLCVLFFPLSFIVLYLKDLLFFVFFFSPEFWVGPMGCVSRDRTAIHIPRRKRIHMRRAGPVGRCESTQHVFDLLGSPGL